MAVEATPPAATTPPATPPAGGDAASAAAGAAGGMGGWGALIGQVAGMAFQADAKQHTDRAAATVRACNEANANTVAPT